MISEHQTLEVFKMTKNDIVQPQDVVEKIFYLKHHFHSMYQFHSPDAHKEFAQWMGIDRVISVATAQAVMSAVEYSYGSIAIQKWCVAFCFTPWLLKSDGRFGVGLCYFSLLSGHAPTQISHLENFVHKTPAFDYTKTFAVSTQHSMMRGGAAR